MNTIPAVTISDPASRLRGWYNYVIHVCRTYVFAVTHFGSNKIIVAQLKAELGFPLIHQWEFTVHHEFMPHKTWLQWTTFGPNDRYAMWKNFSHSVILDLVQCTVIATVRGLFLRRVGDLIFFKKSFGNDPVQLGLWAYSLQHRQEFLVSNCFSDVRPCPFANDCYLLIAVRTGNERRCNPKTRLQVVRIDFDTSTRFQIQLLNKITLHRELDFIDWWTNDTTVLFQDSQGFVGLIKMPQPRECHVSIVGYDPVLLIDRVQGNHCFCQDFGIYGSRIEPADVDWHVDFNWQVATKQKGFETQSIGTDDLVTTDLLSLFTEPQWPGNIQAYPQKQYAFGVLVHELQQYLVSDVAFLVTEFCFWKPVAQHFRYNYKSELSS